MTQTQDEQNVGTPVTPAQDASATTPVTEVKLPIVSLVLAFFV